MLKGGKMLSIRKIRFEERRQYLARCSKAAASGKEIKVNFAALYLDFEREREGFSGFSFENVKIA